jgi:hypothetical protein
MGVEPHTSLGGNGKPRAPQLSAAPSPAGPEQPERHWWAIAALFFPLVFCAIVGMGVFLMFHRQMAYFKPAPSGARAPDHVWAAGTGMAHQSEDRGRMVAG